MGMIQLVVCVRGTMQWTEYEGVHGDDTMR